MTLKVSSPLILDRSVVRNAVYVCVEAKELSTSINRPQHVL